MAVSRRKDRNVDLDDVATVAAALIPLLLLVSFAMVVFIIARGVVQSSRDRSGPVITTPATVLGRRQMLLPGTSTARTAYFATFGLPDGNRIELRVPLDQAGLILEGDRGLLTYQGVFARRFERH